MVSTSSPKGGESSSGVISVLPENCLPRSSYGFYLTEVLLDGQTPTQFREMAKSQLDCGRFNELPYPIHDDFSDLPSQVRLILNMSLAELFETNE